MLALVMSDDDSMKFFVVMIIAIVFLLLARWASRPSHSQSSEEHRTDLRPMDSDFAGSDFAGSDSEEVPPDEPARITWGPSAEEVARSFPEDLLLGRLQIRKFYFAKTEARPGPADPDVFADELFVQFYDPDTDWRWWQSYFVATPRGLAKVLQEKHWKYLHAPQLLAVPRYDLEEIRRAVVSRVVAEHEYYKSLAKEEQVKEETLN